jgi:adenylate cyclase
VDKAVLDELELFGQAVGRYRSQDWEGAEARLQELLKSSPNSHLYQLYRERVDYFRANPPGENWDGVFVFQTK